MIRRYTLPEMGALWTEEAKFNRWLAVELEACRVFSAHGRIPRKDLAAIVRRAGFTVSAIERHERRLQHDVLAFLAAVSDRVGRSARFIHMGLTSYDVVDTGLSIAMREAVGILQGRVRGLAGTLKRLAVRHKRTAVVGRTHGVHAEPTSLGLKFLVHHAEALRNLDRLERAKAAVSVGKLSGAVGNYAHVTPAVERLVLRRLGLRAAPVSTQVLQRDRHAEFLATLAILAGSLEKLATEVRNLQRTEILELEEPFGRGQRGSSAMPHKRNPILSERIAGLARVVRGYATAGLENISLWHERDLTNSSAERVAIPDAAILTDYMLHLAQRVLSGLTVRRDRIKANLERTGGLIYSQRVLLVLVNAGMTRERAYKLVQGLAMKAWAGGATFRERLAADARVRRVLRGAALDACFDPGYYLRHVDGVYRRFGL